MDVLDKMATLVRVMDTGSFSAAGKTLRLSPAAVSRQIAALESTLGVTLLLRTTRRMAPTDEGRTYYEHCVRILREVEDAQSIGARAETSGVLRVSAPVPFGLELVAPQLRPLRKKYPELMIDLRFEDRLADLSLESVDVAIRVGATLPDSTDLVAHRLLVMPRLLLASPGYLKRRGTPRTPEELHRHEGLSPYSGGLRETWTLNADREARIPMTIRARCNSIAVLREMALAGDGIVLMGRQFATKELASGALRHVLPAWQGPIAYADALHRRSLRNTARVRALIDHLRAAYAS